jgi:ketosteroid isomerase-like protein
MTPTNLDLVRSILAAWETGDFSSAAWAHPDIEYVQIGEGPNPGIWLGIPGMTRGFGEWISAWEDYRVVADEYREIDDERVLVLARQSGRGRSSGLEVQFDAPCMFHVRGGKVTRLAVYTHPERALADLGFNE